MAVRRSLSGDAMRSLFRHTFAHPALALCSTLLWGVLEFIALQGARRARRK